MLVPVFFKPRLTLTISPGSIAPLVGENPSSNNVVPVGAITGTVVFGARGGRGVELRGTQPCGESSSAPDRATAPMISTEARPAAARPNSHTARRIRKRCQAGRALALPGAFGAGSEGMDLQGAARDRHYKNQGLACRARVPGAG